MINKIQARTLAEEKIHLSMMIIGLPLHVQSQIPKSVIRQNRTIKHFNIFDMRKHQPAFILEQIITHTL